MRFLSSAILFAAIRLTLGQSPTSDLPADLSSLPASAVASAFVAGFQDDAATGLPDLIADVAGTAHVSDLPGVLSTLVPLFGSVLESQLATATDVPSAAATNLVPALSFAVAAQASDVGARVSALLPPTASLAGLSAASYGSVFASDGAAQQSANQPVVDSILAGQVTGAPSVSLAVAGSLTTMASSGTAASAGSSAPSSTSSRAAAPRESWTAGVIGVVGAVIGVAML